HGWVGRRSCVRLFVNPNELGKRVALERLLLQEIFPAPDHHSKLRPPIADVIVANHVVSEKAGDARESVTERGTANVTDVHRLGHVRRAEINHDFLRRRRPYDAKPILADNLSSR